MYSLLRVVPTRGGLQRSVSIQSRESDKDVTDLFFFLGRAVVVHVQVLDSLGLALAAGHLSVDLLVFGVVKDRGTALGSGLVLVAHDCDCYDGFVRIGDVGCGCEMRKMVW
jgi:hypothetical protein